MNYIFTSALFVFCIFCNAASGTPAEDPIPFWQQSESLNIQLGVRDRNSASESYVAHFEVVRKENGEKFHRAVNVKKDEWGFAFFPDQFSHTAKDGEYEWKCLVDEKTVSYGSFNYSSSERSLVIPAKDK